MGIHNHLEIALINSGMSQQELSIKSGVSETTISQSITGKTKPTRKTLSKIVKGLGIEYADLIKLK